MNKETKEVTKVFPVVDPEYFLKALARINNRAKRLGIGGFKIREIRTSIREQEIVRPEDGKTLYKANVKVTEFEVTGSVPVLEGWQLRATAEFTGADGKQVILNVVPGVELPEKYRTTTKFCEHCDTLRNRKKIVILEHEDGRWVQVGSTCVKDFFGGQSAEAAVGAILFWETVWTKFEEEAERWGSGGARWKIMEGTEFWLTVACEWLNKYPYLSKKKAEDMTFKYGRGYQTTSEEITGYMWDLYQYRKGQSGSSFKPMEISSAAVKEAKEIIAWGSQLSPKNDYQHNLKVILSEETFEYKFRGYLISAVPAFRKEMDRKIELEKQGVNSVHQGQIKERIERTVKVNRKQEFETDYGTSFLFIMEDAEGNIYKWFASVDAMDKGDTVRLKGTVKGHDHFNKFAQTTLTRCAVLEVISSEAIEEEQRVAAICAVRITEQKGNAQLGNARWLVESTTDKESWRVEFNNPSLQNCLTNIEKAGWWDMLENCDSWCIKATNKNNS